MKYQVGANIPQHWLEEYRWKQTVAENPDPPITQILEIWQLFMENLFVFMGKTTNDFCRLLLWVVSIPKPGKRK